jgi:16S rRNA (guanine966-N2)-methyltransferase
VRIVGGRWAGRDLTSPGGRVRPTAEPVREAALTWVAAELPDGLPEVRVLDLFAGTGALGLEALSRGAGTADFVESNPSALHALKANVTALRLRPRTRIFKKDVFRFLQRVAAGSYEVALADPPYTSALARKVVEIWLDRPFARLLLVETPRGADLPRGAETRTIGDTDLSLYRSSS